MKTIGLKRGIVRFICKCVGPSGCAAQSGSAARAGRRLAGREQTIEVGIVLPMKEHAAQTGCTDVWEWLLSTKRQMGRACVVQA